MCHLCMHVQMYVGTHTVQVYVHICRSKRLTPGIFLNLFIPYSLWKGILAEPTRLSPLVAILLLSLCSEY